MARPIKNNCEYFSHDNDMRHNRKVKALMNETANYEGLTSRDGYAFWNMLLEYLTDMDGHEFEFTPTELAYFSAEIGLSLPITEYLVEYCIKIKLLQKDDDNFISCESLIERLSAVYSKRNRDRKVSKSKIKKQQAKIVNEKQLSLTISSQPVSDNKVSVSDNKVSTHLSLPEVHKVKESKVNKTKREIIEREINSLTPEFLKMKYLGFLEWTESFAVSLFLLDEFITIGEYQQLIEKYKTEPQKEYLEKKLLQMHNKKGLEHHYTNVYQTLLSWIRMDDDITKNKILKG